MKITKTLIASNRKQASKQQASSKQAASKQAASKQAIASKQRHSTLATTVIRTLITSKQACKSLGQSNRRRDALAGKQVTIASKQIAIAPTGAPVVN